MSSDVICVAFGGNSPEHEVSVITAIQAMEALKETNKTVLPFYVSKSSAWFTGEVLKDISNYENLSTLESQAIPCHFELDELGHAVLMSNKKPFFGSPKSWKPDVVLMAFHGADGENGAFQGLFRTLNLPFTGSTVLGSSVGMDKEISKKLCKTNGISVTDDIVFYETDWTNQQEEILAQIRQLSYPVIVKPSSLGSSIGVKRAHDESSLITAVETAFRFDDKLIVEQAIHPLIEINCSVRGSSTNPEASVCEMPKGNDEALTFEDKYLSGESGKGMASADRIIPAPISDDLTNQIQDLSKKIYRVLQASGLARLDFLINADTEKIYFNEINTIPGSFSYYLWDKSNVSFKDLLLEMIDEAKIRQRQTTRITSYETNLLSLKSSQGIKGLKTTK